ncbi:MAG: AraC family transcriptional regulator, partial [Calditrichaeota bacterium]
LFRKLKGLTDERPQEFIRSLRLKQAARLLTDSKMTITEICYACGFNFPAHFTLQFRAKYGLNPNEYRKQDGRLSQPFPPIM